MPYTFSRRRLRSTDVLDPIEMDADFQPAAEKYSGRLNAHDFTGTPMKANATVASRAYYRVGHVTRSVAPGYAHGATHPQVAGGGPDAVFTLINDRGWHTVTDMELTLTTGVASLWIIGWVQYSRHTWPFSTVNDTHFQSNVQFAISVDGQIVEATITGKRESYERNWLPGRADPQWNNATPTAFPGPGIVQPGDTPAGMGPHFAAVRLGCAHPVAPGSHTIRILARRAPRATLAGVYSNTDYIVCYSRRLFVLESGQFPGNASTPSTVDVAAIQPEATLSAAAMGTSRATLIRDAYNSVAAGALARGALRNEHLPSVVRASGIATFGPTVSQLTNDIYPGYGTSTFAGARTGATGWWELDDGAGGTLRTGAGLNRANGTIIVLGNAHVSGVITDAVAPNGEFHHFGVLTLGYNDGVNSVVIGATEAGVNSCNLLEDGVAANLTDRNIEADVPVFFVHEPTDTVLPAGALSYLSLYGSTLDSENPAAGRVSMTWRSGQLLAIQLRD